MVFVPRNRVAPIVLNVTRSFGGLSVLSLLLGLLLVVSTLVATPHGVPPAGAQSSFPVWDTAWELPSRSTLAEAETYFAYVANQGFDGVWLSYLNQDGIDGKNANGHRAARVNASKNIVLDPNHAKHVRDILDLAHSYELEVNMVAAWGSTYLNKILDANGECVLNKGVLKRRNAEFLGVQLGEAIGSHPALAMWILGGDNWCDNDSDAEDPQIWANMKDGLRAAGSMQPTGYHTGGWRSAVLKFIDEPWIDAFAVQSSHCRTADQAGEIIQAAMDRTDKPVIAAEMRYEAIEPPWCDDPTDAGPGRPVTSANVLADARKALALGTAGYAYGHNERWLWGGGDHGSTGKGFPSVQASFFAPGERAVLDLFGRQPAQVYCNGRLATIVGNGGDNVLLGTNSADVVVSFGGDDTLTMLGSNDVVCAGEGDDRIDGGRGRDILFGEGGNDRIAGGSGDDLLLRGGDGDDIVDGGRGNDTMYGDAGNDRLRGASGNDVLWGGLGNDNLKGNGGNDIIEGGWGNDRVDGGGGNDRVNGGSDNDKVIGGKGRDVCDGGTGKNAVHRSCETGR